MANRRFIGGLRKACKQPLLSTLGVAFDTFAIEHGGKRPGLQIHRARCQEGGSDEALDRCTIDCSVSVLANSTPVLDHIHQFHRELLNASSLVGWPDMPECHART